MPPIPHRQSSSTIPTSTSILPSDAMLSDLASFKSQHIILPTSSPSTASPEPDLLLEASYDFVKNARAALTLQKQNLIEEEGEKMERTREKLDQVLEGLGSHVG